MSEGIRDLLATTFHAVVMVADDVSLFESAGRLQSDVAVVDLALARGEGLDFVRRLRSRFSGMKIIIIGPHDEASVSRSVLDAGADAYVVKSAISTDLLAAADAVLAGQTYVSPQVGRGVAPV
jgi:DNA-binding NarL/FixJ family response regulator